MDQDVLITRKLIIRIYTRRAGEQEVYTCDMVLDYVEQSPRVDYWTKPYRRSNV